MDHIAKNTLEPSRTRTFLLRGCFDVGNDMGGNQTANIEGADQVDSDDLLKDVQWLRLAIPEHNLPPADQFKIRSASIDQPP